MKGLELSAKTNTRGMILTVILYAVGAVSVPFLKIADLFGGSFAAQMLCGSVCKTVCAALPLYLVCEFGMKGEFRFSKGIGVGLLLSVPAFVVALDNFPIIPEISGDMSIKLTFWDFIPYLLYCVSIGLLEESIFRGNILPLFMYAFSRDKKGLFWAVVCSSAVFGAMHLLNLFGGFSPFVFLQVGYSFLIGCTCAVAMLLTGNLFAAVAVHSLFDIGGFLFDNFGTGTLWTGANMIFTAIISVVCAAALIIIFIKTDFSGDYESWGLNNRPPEEH